MNYFVHHYLNYRTSLKLASCGLLVLVADFLFYKESIGWTLGIFGALLFIAIRMHQRTVSNRTSLVVTSCAALGLVLALIETPSSTASKEMMLHGVRNFFYAIVFFSFGWMAWHGAYAWVFAGIILTEVMITLWDFVEEDRTPNRDASAGQHAKKAFHHV